MLFTVMKAYDYMKILPNSMQNLNWNVKTPQIVFWQRPASCKWGAKANLPPNIIYFGYFYHTTCSHV